MNSCKLRILAASGILCLGIAAAAADPVEDFYRGREIQIAVGNPPGGGYDAYARLLARYIGRYMPGKPNVTVANMPGASGLVVSNSVSNVAAKDGTALAMPNRNNAVDPLFGNAQARFDPRKLNWIGSMNNEVSVCGAWHSTGIGRFEDLMQRQLIVGSTGNGDDTQVLPTVVNRILGTKMKIVSGYPGGNDIDLALERGELEGRCGMSYSTLASSRQNWLDGKLFTILAQLSTTKHPQLPDIPLVTDLPMQDLQRQTLGLIFARQHWGRPFFAPAEVPRERVDALRQAFMKAMEDPDLQAEAAKAKLEAYPVAGTVMQREILDVYASPPALVEAAKIAIQ